jgi:ADP-ribosylglycohydrolase
VGGDVDTTAAMAGAIAGARNGLGAIPAALIEPLNDRGQWRSEALIGLARRFWRLKNAPPPG